MSDERHRIPPDVLNSPTVTPFAPFVSSSPTRLAASRQTESPLATTLLAEIAGYGALVKEIGAALDISSDQLAAVEALERVETTSSLPIEQITGWNGKRVAEWFSAFGSDLQIDLRLSGLDSQTTATNVVLRAGHNPAGRLHDFIANAESAMHTQGNELAIEARLSVAKGRAIAAASTLLSGRADYFGAPEMIERTKLAVFYHSAAWHRLLSPRALFDWEALGLVRENTRAVVVLCDSAGYLAGLALDVIGARLLDDPRWLSVSRSAWRQFQDRSRRILQLREEESQWADAHHVLTPSYLRIEERQPGLLATREHLAKLRAILSAVYLASSVHSERDVLALRLAGPRPVSCQIALSRSDTSVSSVETTYQGAALARLCDWAYGSMSPDKLAIVRECLIQELRPGAAHTLRDLEDAAAFALDAARANLVLYLHRNTEQYFRMRQQALETVSDYTAGVRKAVADLTGDVVDNVYRTVGLLVAVILAALLQPSVSLNVQRLAAFLYTLYIVFVIVFVLEARRQHFALESADLDGRLATMPELSTSELERLRTQASSNDAYFEYYFRWSRFIYLGLGAVGLLYLLLLLTPLARHLPLT